MAGLSKYVQWTWELSVAVQVLVCALLFWKGNFRRLPWFTAYVLSNICQAVAVYLTYIKFGFASRPAAVIAWSLQCVPQLLRVAATTEAIRLILKTYRGIWGLAWRVLATAFAVVFFFAVLGSGRELSWAIAAADRGFHLAFGVALVACLLVVRYYSIPVPSAYKALLGGFCFYSCTAVLANTIGRALYLHGHGDFQAGWQLLTMGAFVVVLAIWGLALRKPLAESARQQPYLPEAERTYWEISPRINERLRALNERLDNFWNPEATQS
jgi:hypothetical protein